MNSLNHSQFYDNINANSSGEHVSFDTRLWPCNDTKILHSIDALFLYLLVAMLATHSALVIKIHATYCSAKVQSL